jgi:hypothetical protein
MPRKKDTYRLLKWVGDPVVLRKDGFRVANWKYENKRVIPVPGKSRRVITPYDVIGKDQYGRPVTKPNGLSQEYVWHKNTPNYVIPVKTQDAMIILERCGKEFIDVTDERDPAKVHKTPIIMPV